QVDSKFFKEHQQELYQALEDKHTTLEMLEEDDPLNTKMVLNMGPQHPATHGVLRLILQLNGELIEKAKVDVGYLHRGVEKIAENKTYQEFMPYTDRMDYLSPYNNNVALCTAVEKIANVEVPERAHYIRMIGCELSRLTAHLIWIGTLMQDMGAVSYFLWAFREREKLHDIFDHLAGHRFTVSHSRIGGVHNDITDTAMALIKDFVDTFPQELKDWHMTLDRNRIFFDRNRGVGVLETEDALDSGATGPTLRGSGYAYDMRKIEPYARYDEVEFEVPTRLEGDNLARYYVRMEEMHESIRIIRQCIDKLPKGPVRADNAKHAYPSKDEVYYSMEGMIHDFMMTDTGICPPDGAEAYHAVEAAKGELGYFVQSDGTGHPWRLKINAPSFKNIQILEQILEGEMVSDAVLIVGGVDPVMGECDK